MNYRDLGNTGLKVSEIGMGCEGFAEDDCRNTKRLYISVPFGKTGSISVHGIFGR